jgi:hypothetical protein
MQVANLRIGNKIVSEQVEEPLFDAHLGGFFFLINL